MAIKLTNLNGPQRKIVRDAFLAAFNNESLALLLNDKLDKQLDQLVNVASGFQMVVFNLINLSQREGWTEDLVQAAENSSKHPRIHTLRQTLETSETIKLTEVDAQVKTASPAAGGLERMVRAGGFADWGLWVGRMTEIGRQICRIDYPVGVKMGGGTGFLVAPDLVLTNYHVIAEHHKKVSVASDITCRFDFGVGLGQPTPIKLVADWLVDFSVYSSHDPGDKGGLPDADHLDYALLRLERPIGDENVNGAKRGCITLRDDTAIPGEKDIVLIGQHPELEPLKLAVGVVLKANTNGTRLCYDANTERGSSGSPCFDIALNVVALHHGGDPDYTHLMGKFNQGIPTCLILKRMQTRGVAKFWS